MSARAAAIALQICGVMAFPQYAYTAGVADDRGVVQHREAPVRRIVTLAPHLAEMVYAAGAGERLVGAVEFSDFPDAARRLPRVGNSTRVDAERVLMLRPDLVLAWKSGNPLREVRRLEELGLPVFVTEAARLSDVSRLLRTIGAMTGTLPAARRSAEAFDEELAALRARFANAPAVRVFYEIWHRPLLTINGGHMISDVIRLCGGVNVFADASALTPSVSLEAVLAARPQAIVGGGSGASAEEFAAPWRVLNLAALKDAAFLYVAPDEIQRPTPRILHGARAVCEGLERLRSRLRGDVGAAATARRLPLCAG